MKNKNSIKSGSNTVSSSKGLQPAAPKASSTKQYLTPLKPTKSC